MKLIKLFLISILPSSSLTATPVEEGFVSLFNGKDLTGWTVISGTAPFVARDGQIIGTTAKGSPNTFLTTDKHYSDFDLRFDVKIDDARLNSGCQVRSNSSQDFRGGRVNGYQVELMSNKGTAGFIYHEGRKKWLSEDRVDEVKNKAFKTGEWNKLRIVCHGSSLKTWINDIPIADVTHSMTSSGFIGLQVHEGGGDRKWSVRWKNIRIKEFPSTFKPLYNGKDLTNFKTTGNWVVEKDGVLELKPREGEEGGARYTSYLWADKQYENFSCDFEYSLAKGGNSGFFFRVQDRDKPETTGIEIQISDSFGKKTELTDQFSGGVVDARPPAENMSKPAPEWNKMSVLCEGDYLKVWLNGKKIQDMYLYKTKFKKHPLKGYFGFQDHGVGFKLRNINIKKW